VSSVVAAVDGAFEGVFEAASTEDEDSSLLPSLLHSTSTPIALICYCGTAGNPISGIQHSNIKS
jgi:hypothetical protein